MGHLATQKEKVLKHMREKGSIDTWQAIEWYGITRLASRITDLKNDGHCISKSRKKVKTRDGSTTTVIEYKLED